MLKTEKLAYQDGDVQLLGYVAYDNSTEKKRPGILIAHDWSGQTEFNHKKAEKLAELGYVGFALDMYGDAKSVTTKEEKSALAQPFFQDRAKMQHRMLVAYETLKKIAVVDSQKIGAIGFCFGGTCALDLARTGADLKATVSFHGGLGAPDNIKQPKIKASILALHGFDDPMVTHDAVIKFGEEMTKANADWELTMYGNAMHAFTNPQANDPEFGTVYNKKADTRSWIAMRDFFKEIFGM